MSGKPIAIEKRFWKKVEVNNPFLCWEWIGARNNKGYGMFWDGRLRVASNVAYELAIGKMNKPEIDHLCKNPGCVNPYHLEPVTRTENVRRSSVIKTHCPKGHKKEGNLTRYNCKTCKREYDRKRRNERRRT